MTKQYTLVVQCVDEGKIEAVSNEIEAKYASYVSLRTDGDIWDLTADGIEGKRALWQVALALRAKFGKQAIEADWDE